MDPEQFFPGCFPYASTRASVKVAGSLQVTKNTLETLGTLRMPCGNPMLDHPTIRVQADHHGSSDPDRSRIQARTNTEGELQ
jgi:hypothetical protein